MNILVVNPPYVSRFSRSQRSPAVTKGGTFYYPVWLAYATGVLEQEGFTVKLIDAVAQKMDLEHTLAMGRIFNPELVVVDTSTPSIYNDVRTAAALKDALPESWVTLVGTHPSALPAETLGLCDKVDSVARGEYEYTLRDLAYALEKRDSLESILGLSFRVGERIVHNPPRPLIEDLDALPFVSQVYEKHLNVRDYYFAASNYPMAMIMTGRGCPYRCFFCVYPQTLHGRKYRFRSPENVVTEFEYIRHNLPEVKEVAIEDDTFTANRERCREICSLIIARKLGITWYANARADLDLATMKIMKQAGCRLLVAGFESGNQTVLNRMHKGLKLESSRQFMRDAREVGLLVHGCFMVGNPGESMETMRQTLKFAEELNCDSAQFYPVFVYPGTEAFHWAQNEGYLLTSDYAKWLTPDGSHNCVINLPGLSASEMARFCEKAYLEYHLRPHYILSKLGQLMTHPSEGLRSMRGAVNLFRRLLTRLV